MKKFKFRLERVLNYREAIREEKKTELAKKNAELNERVSKLEMLEEAFLKNEAALDESGNVSLLRIAGLYAARLKSEIANQIVSIEEAQEEVEVARIEYIEAAKDAKTLDTLKQKKLEEYKEYIAKEDEKFLDEMTIQKGNRMGH